MNPTWTNAQIETLRLMWKEGASVTEIAAAIGRQGEKNAVIGKAHRLKLGRHKTAPGFISAYKRKSKAKAVSPPSPPGRLIMSPQFNQSTLPRQASVEAASASKPAGLRDLRPDASAHSVLFLNSRPGQCKWPLNDVKPIEKHLWCGATTVDKEDPNCAYCSRHAAMAYSKRAA